MQLPNYVTNKKNSINNPSYIEVSMYFSSELIYFDGHFDDWPVLPAVAQLFIIQQLVEKEFGLMDLVVELKQTKFISPIFPDTKAVISIYLDLEKRKIEFEYLVEAKKKSFGTINY